MARRAGMIGLREALDEKGWAGKTSSERMRESRDGKSVRQMLRDCGTEAAVAGLGGPA